MISARKNKRKVLAVIMDGVGVREQTYGNAVALAATPAMDYLRHAALGAISRALFTGATSLGLLSNGSVHSDKKICRPECHPAYLKKFIIV